MVGFGRQRRGTVRQRTRPRGMRMIVTLTMNPALDITTSADHVRPTDKIRCRAARYDAGGGGINVARVASVLGASVSAVFPVGGPTGDLLTSSSATPTFRIAAWRFPFRLGRVSPLTKGAAGSSTASSFPARI